MARSDQTRAPPRDIPRVQKFLDHAGTEAIRARIARPGRIGDIASDDFSKNPVFVIQVYTLVGIHLDEPSTKRMRIDTEDGGPPTQLHALVRSLGPINSEGRPPPVFDIYPDLQPDAFACVDHQKREIAHRKRLADKPETLLIPKFSMDFGSRHKSGFCIIITGDVRDIRSRGARDTTSLLWARFKRGTSSYHDFEVSFTRLMDYSAQNGDRASEFQMCYDESFARRDIDCDLEWDPEEVIEPLEKYCELGLEDEEEGKVTNTAESLDDLAKRLPSDDFTMDTKRDAAIISNHQPNGEPDLRYLIYVPFLSATASVPTSLEQVGKAFTAAITPHLTAGKTISFEFRIPPEPSHSSILTDYHNRMAAESDNYIGALLNLEEDIHNHAFTGRLHCQSENLHRRYNIFDETDVNDTAAPVRYKTFVVILRDPDLLAKGSVEYLLADGVPGEHVKRWRQMFDEMLLWRNRDGGIEETARRLEMRFED